MVVRTIQKKPKKRYMVYPMMAPEERLRLLRGIHGMWKNRKPDPIKELKRIRKGWDRKLPIR